MDARSIIKKIVDSNKKSTEQLFLEKGKVYSFINPYGYHLLRNNKELYDLLDGLFVDGILMCLLTRLYFGYSIQRRSFDMTSVAKDCFEYLSNSNDTVYFVGASEEEISATIELLEKEYPRMNIAGYRNGFFDSNEERISCIKDIIDKADIVIVGMGAVLQERFIVDLKQCGYNGIAFTCGGYLRQASTGLDYYPEWVDKYNLRGFYRLFNEKGMLKRLFNVLIEFPVLYLYDRIQTKCD